VDAAIVVVENIVRHYRLPENQGRSISEIAIEAVDAVGTPPILAPFALIAAIIPMAFVRGLMGPYMRPIPIGASAAMLFSLLVAFIVTPWASLRLLRREGKESHGEESWTTRLYRRAMTPLLHNPWWRYGFLLLVVFLLLSAVSLIALKFVRVKMLPFDNKSEFQVIIDMPEDSTLETTAALTREIGDALRTVLSEVFDDQDRQYKDIILLTDGEDHESFPVEAAAEAGRRGVRLFAVGLGDDREGRRVPIGEGGRKRFLTYREQEVWSQLDAATLRRMAAATPQGRYLHVATGAVDLGDIYEKVMAGAEKRKLESESLTRYEEKFQIFIGLALLLLVLETFIGERRRERSA